MLINGIAGHELNIQDRGLQYGDGLFETIAISNEEPRHWDDHIHRLISSCQRLKIPAPAPSLLLREAKQLIAEQENDKAVLKIIYTRGASSRGYKLPEQANPTRILTLSAWPDFPTKNAEEGINLTLCETRLGHNASLAGMKHLNRLEQVLARAEWDNPDIAEGIMMDQNGYVIEGTMSNLFFVRDGILCTPSLQACGIEGIMRQNVLRTAEKHAITTMVEDFTLRDVLEADEVFICNSLITIWPVQNILAETHHNLPTPGLITQKIQVELDA